MLRRNGGRSRWDENSKLKTGSWSSNPILSVIKNAQPKPRLLRCGRRATMPESFYVLIGRDENSTKFM